MAMVKVMRRFTAITAVSLISMKVISEFMSWLSRQDDAPAEAWIDEEECEEV